MAELNLLPRKEFEILLKSGVKITGKYGFWPVKRFTDKKGIKLSQLREYLSPANITIDDMCEIILCAIEYLARKEKREFKYTDMDACEWIEEMGGLDSEMYQNLCNHAGDPLEEDDDEKKNHQLSGKTSKESVLQPG